MQPRSFTALRSVQDDRHYARTNNDLYGTSAPTHILLYPSTHLPIYRFSEIRATSDEPRLSNHGISTSTTANLQV